MPINTEPATIAQHVKDHGAHCPFCSSDEIEGDGVEIDGGDAYQDVTCNDCGAEWSDRYQLASFIVYVRPEAAP
jgi:transposase-like protein